MVTFLVARVPAGPSGVAAELVLGPVSALLRRQLDAAAAMAQAGATLAREGADRLDPGVAGAVAGLAAVVVVSFLVAGLAGLATLARRRVALEPRGLAVADSESPRVGCPERADALGSATRGGGRSPSGSARGGWTAGACGGSPTCGSRWS